MAQTLIIVRNSSKDELAERIADYAEITSAGDGVPCQVDLLEDGATGELIIKFPGGIPYAHFSFLLNALNMPWVNNPGAKAAGWANAGEEDKRYMFVTTKDEADFLIGIDTEGKTIISAAGEVDTLTLAEGAPAEYYEPQVPETLTALASFTVMVDIPEEEEEITDEATVEATARRPIDPASVKKLSTTTVVIIIAVVSAVLIGLIVLAG